MNILNFLKLIAPYVVSIFASVIMYIQAKKKLTQELEIVKTNNKHEIDKIIKQHNINIEKLKEQHIMEKELKEKEYQYEKEILELQSTNLKNEKTQEIVTNFIGNFLNNLMSGEITPEKINNWSKMFNNEN